MHLSQSRYRVRDLPWKVPPSEEEVSPSAVPPSAGSGVPAESLWPPDWPERHAFPSAPPGSLQRTVVSSSRMKGCIVTQELREVNIRQLFEACYSDRYALARRLSKRLDYAL